MGRTKAFTLVELAMVVVLAAILLSVATETGRNAAIRSRIVEERKMLQRIRQALRNYYVDNGEYVGDSAIEDYSMAVLTTPIAYLPSIPRSLFFDRTDLFSRRGFTISYWGGASEFYGTAGRDLRKKYYAVTTIGPDGSRQFASSDLWERNGEIYTIREGPNFRSKLYDPTNGAVSEGDMVASPDALYN